MVIVFDRTLEESLATIGFAEGSGEHVVHLFHQEERPFSRVIKSRKDRLQMDFLELIQFVLPQRLNAHYASRLREPLVCHILDGDYRGFSRGIYPILFEAHSSAVFHSQYEFPSALEAWIAPEGFLVGVEQKGAGFDAVKINKDRTHREGGGGGFDTYRNSPHTVFFDTPRDTRIVYIEFLLATLNREE